MRSSLITLAALLLSLFLVVAGFADVVELKEGRTLRGKISSINDTDMVLIIDAITCTLRIEDIAAYEIDGKRTDLSKEKIKVKAKPTPTPTPTPIPAKPKVKAITGTELLNAPVVPAALPLGKTMRVKGINVRLRSGPGTDFERVGQVSTNRILSIFREEDGWYKCSTDNGQQGWIYGQFVEPMQNKMAVVKGVRLNLRESPSLDTLVRGQLQRGDVVLELERRKSWSMVRIAAGKSGWVNNKYLMLDVKDSLVRPKLRSSGVENPLPVEKVAAANGQKEMLRLPPESGLLVRGGRLALVFFSKEKKPDWSGLRKLPSVKWSSVISVEQAEAYRFDPQLLEGVENILIIHVLGQQKKDRWLLPLNSSVLEKNPCMVGQEGGLRGTLFPLKLIP
jgi:SH3-like domain-containing protein